MKKIHYISIMICIVTVFMVYDYHIVQENKQLKAQEEMSQTYYQKDSL